MRGFDRAGLFLGFGTMGAIDGILFHQLLQWHHMVMTDGPPFWMFTDGLFHTFAVSMILLGAWLLWRSCSLQRVVSDRLMQASILAGMGLFNLIEGLIVHHLLELHHVKPGPNQLSWDLLYLASGAVLVAWGARLRRESL